MKQTISILGCGWLGYPTAIELLKNYSINGSTTSQEKLALFKEVGITPHLFSLENFDELSIISFLKAEILLVALPSKNVEGFKKLLQFIDKSPIKKVLFISSTSVYKATNEIVTEESELQNAPLVEIEKLFLENANFKTTIIRFAGLFGYNRKPGNFFKDGRKIPNPNGFVNMIHQDDCVAMLDKIIAKNIFGEIFNACADTHPTRKAYYIKVKNDIGVEPPIFDESTIFPFKIVSNAKIKNHLNYTFKYPDLLKIDYNSSNI